MGDYLGSLMPTTAGQDAQARGLADATNGYKSYRDQVWDATMRSKNDALSALQGANNALATGWGDPNATQAPGAFMAQLGFSGPTAGNDFHKAMGFKVPEQTPMGQNAASMFAPAVTGPVHSTGRGAMQTILDPLGIFGG